MHISPVVDIGVRFGIMIDMWSRSLRIIHLRLVPGTRRELRNDTGIVMVVGSHRRSMSNAGMSGLIVPRGWSTIRISDAGFGRHGVHPHFAISHVSLALPRTTLARSRGVVVGWTGPVAFFALVGS